MPEKGGNPREVPNTFEYVRCPPPPPPPQLSHVLQVNLTWTPEPGYAFKGLNCQYDAPCDISLAVRIASKLSLAGP